MEKLEILVVEVKKDVQLTHAENDEEGIGNSTFFTNPNECPPPSLPPSQNRTSRVLIDMEVKLTPPT